jgi:CitB family two-component system response regulator MalR
MIKTFIVEDDPMVAEFNRRYLEKINGYKLVGIASSFDEALPIIKNEEIDLILLDIYMPGENGWSLLSKIRGLGKGIDVIIITAACDKQSIKNGLRFGAVDYLIKPFEFGRFKAALTFYQEEQILINNQEKLNQNDLDNILHHKDQPIVSGFEIPKGLTKSTLVKVWEKIIEKQNDFFSTDELAQLVGISRVSMRKYLFFLTEINILETEVVYGAIGRPVYMHRINNIDYTLINNYINSP